ncbi:MAG: penicillin-binding protein 2 [Candidatus Nanopelagicales bacterium]
MNHEGTNAPVAKVRRRDARIIVLQVLVISLIGTLFFRVAWMQLGDSAQYRTAGTSNSVREVIVPAQRGLILDQAGRPMVANRSGLSVTVDRAELARQGDGGKAVLTELANKLGTTHAALVDRMKPCGTPGAPKQPLCWNGPRERPVIVAEDVPQEVGLQLMEAEGAFRAVRTELTPTRSYPKPYGINFAHLAGYLGPMTGEEVAELDEESQVALANSMVGRSGLEQTYNDVLSGRPGVQQVSVSRSGKVTETLRDEAAQAGDNVVTSVDAKLQALVERQLVEALDRGRDQGKPSDSGTIIVSEVETGRILAMASAPTYDPQVWVGGIKESDYNTLTDPDKGNPLLNRATQGTYAPASTFKVVSTAAAIKAGYSPTNKYACPAMYDVGGQLFRNYESRAYGSIDFAKALSVSCDTVYYKLANEMWLKDGGLNPSGKPAEAMYNMALAFGLGKKTGIDVPGESAGRVVGRDQKQADYEERREDFCNRATEGYPEVKPKDRAELLQAYAKDFCAEGDKYRAGDALNFAIGQGDTVVTPLQVNSMYAAIANGGELWQPTVAKAVVSREGEVRQEFAPESIGRLDASESTLSFLRQALADTSVTGTASGAFRGFPLGQIPVASKTGTGEVVGKVSTSWFSSFAPATKPKYAVTCMVSQGGTGAGTCGPSVRAIYEALFGVSGTTVNPGKSVFAGGKPSAELPAVTSDGIGKAGQGIQPVSPSVTNPPPAGGESPVPGGLPPAEVPRGFVNSSSPSPSSRSGE